MADNRLKKLFTDIAVAIRETLPDIGKMSPYSYPDNVRAVASAGGDTTQINALLDEINGEVINGKIVTFIGDTGEVLYETSVVHGTNCLNPVSKGLISTPKKESTETEIFTFSGWSLTEGGEADSTALQNITSDRTVYAAFSPSIRYYTVKFYSDNKLQSTSYVEYGGSAEYTVTKVGHHFMGWLPEPLNITADIECHAQWQESNLSSDSWERIISVSESGEAASMYSIGDEKELEVVYANGSSEKIIMRVAAFDTDKKSDNSKAGMTLIAKTPLATPMAWCTTKHTSDEYDGVTGYAIKGYAGSDILTYLNDIVKPALPAALQKGLKSVLKQGNWYVNPTLGMSYGLADINSLWIPSVGEVLYGATPNDGSTCYLLAFDSNEDRIVNLYDSGEAVAWWTRTIDGTNDVRIITANGKSSYRNANSADVYVVIGFCI